MTNLTYKEAAFEITGAAIQVLKEPEHGFLEAVYQLVLERELIEGHKPYKKPEAITDYLSKLAAKEDKHWRFDLPRCNHNRIKGT